MELDVLISFIVATIVLACSPGPDNMFVLTQSITHGSKYGLATVVGLILGCLVHTTLVAFGVSAIIKEHDNLFFAIKTFGALYLLYLSYQVFRADTEIHLSKRNTQSKPLLQLLKQGFTMNVLNPKVSIFFLAFFPGFLFSKEMNNVLQFYILGAIFMSVSLIIFSIIAFLAGVISEKIKNNKQVGIYLKWMQIVAFMTIAIFILI
ncbi:LysE family translocator [Tenacibaculum maritimum]|uniref:LysE type amino acid transporter n=1 Tax=Tenacibaculum maritimum NCIMB 2154 TaxID=1349785 RepID=A0A2H1E9M9_9FLAO|nr:LysE family translocator [Tenacibaculum maritimum]SFZ82339.1 LysE type amino acid transporter [Tenacibaculum maritimum NCIMB 2154]